MSFRLSPLFALLAFASGLAAQPYILSTYAGRGVTPTPVTATQATIAKPYGIAHAGGKVYFSANHVVYVVDSTGLMKRVAGTGTPGFSGDGGLAVNARLNFPSGLSADSAGNVYIADTGNFRIRKVTSAGIVSTVAGNENGGTPPLTGVATAVPLMPSGVVADASGNFWIADKSGVLKVSASGILTNIYSSGGLSPSLTNYLTTMALDSAGSVYFPLQSGRDRKSVV